MIYYIGLSILSNNDNNHDNKGNACKKLLQEESMRILSLLEGRPVKNDEIERDRQGRPFFPGSNTNFNISHSGNLAAVSLVKPSQNRNNPGGLKPRTGCDVELVRPRPRMKDMAEEFFTPAERDYIFGSRFDEARFFHIWTLKESYLKLRGLTVFDIKNAPSFICCKERAEGQFAFNAPFSSALSFNLYELSGSAGGRYILAAALEADKDESGGSLSLKERSPEILWFSQSLLDCKSIVKIKAAQSPEKTVMPKI